MSQLPQPDNSLELQRRYFEYVVRSSPRDEAAWFALGQVLNDLGLFREADECYQTGVALTNRKWLTKLPIFVILSGGVAAALWFAGLRWVWLPPVLVAASVTTWFVIRRNRLFWVPQVGFWKRQNTIETLNLATEIDRIEQSQSNVLRE